MARAPPSFSSAGWKMKCTVPAKSGWLARAWAAPSSMVVWPSWPQACMRPSCCDLWAQVFSSCTCSASMSARRPMLGPSPRRPRSTATMPVPARPVCTSSPQPCSSSATRALVRCSWNAVSGWRWKSCRQACRVSCVGQFTLSFGLLIVQAFLQGTGVTGCPRRTGQSRPQPGTRRHSPSARPRRCASPDGGRPGCPWPRPDRQRSAWW